MSRSVTRVAVLLGALTLACGSAPETSTPPEGSTRDEPPSVDPAPAPSYAELFETYFAPGTPGHCATAGCHADPGHAVWLCGTTKSDCYAGMVDVGLIDTAQPVRSALVDPHRSPLTWINPAGGTMPLDAQGESDQAAAALRAWVAAGARKD
jgi:hypothetical protein